MDNNLPLRVLFLFVLLTCVSSLSAQIVNIERRRIPIDSTGWYGEANFSFAGSKTTRSIVAFRAGTFLEYKPKCKKEGIENRDLWLLISDFSLISGDDEKFSNAGFAHLRFNRRLNKSIKWEAFSQIQYNGLTKIDNRILLGTGPRFKLTKSDSARFYFGIAYMYEYQELLEPLVFESLHRMSSYFTFTLMPESNVTFISTTYFQPVITDFADYRLSNETGLFLDVTKKLTLSIKFNYNYNTTPPEGVPNSTYYFSNGLGMSF